MSNHEAMTPTRESSVSDQRHFVTEPTPHDGAGGAQHLAHARPAARTFVADHHHIARLHLAGKDGGSGTLFAIKHTRGTIETQAFLAGDFRDRSFGREV